MKANVARCRELTKQQTDNCQTASCRTVAAAAAAAAVWQQVLLFSVAPLTD
jgi:hypothetical protein